MCPLYHFASISNINLHAPFFVNCYFTMFSFITILSLECCLICDMHAYFCMLMSIAMLVLLTETIGFVTFECASDGHVWITNASSHPIAICSIINSIYFSFIFVLFTIKKKDFLSYSHNHINHCSQLTLLN